MAIIDFEMIPNVSQISSNDDSFDYYTKSDLATQEALRARLKRLSRYASECLKKGSNAGRRSCIDWKASDGVSLREEVSGNRQSDILAFVTRADRLLRERIPKEIAKIQAELKTQADATKLEADTAKLEAETDVLKTEVATETGKNIFMYVIMAAIALVVVIVLIRAFK